MLKKYVARGAAQAAALDGCSLAPFHLRAGALVIDLLLLNLVMLVGSLIWALSRSRPVSTLHFEAIDAIHTWWAFVAVVSYFGATTFLGRGQSPGKRLMQIRVVSLVHERLSLWHCIERALGYGASTLELGFGFFQYFIHPNAQTVHDRIAETIVVAEARVIRNAP